MKHIVSMVEDKNVDLANENAQLNKRITAAESILNDRQADSREEELKSQLTAVSRRLEETNATLYERTQDLNSTHESLFEKENLLKESLKKIEALSSELQITKSTCQELVKAIAKSDNQLNTIQSDYSSLLVSKEKIEQISKSRIESLEMRNEDMRMQATTIAELDDALNKVITENDLLIETVFMQEEDHLQASIRISEAKATIKREQEQLESMRKTKDGLQIIVGDLASKVATAAEVEQRLQAAAVDSEKKIKKLRKQVKDQESQIGDLDAKMKASLEELEFLVDENGELAREIEILTMYAEDVRTKYGLSVEAANNAVGYSRYLEDQLQAARKKERLNVFGESASVLSAGDLFGDVSSGESYGYFIPRTGEADYGGKDDLRVGFDEDEVSVRPDMDDVGFASQQLQGSAVVVQLGDIGRSTVTGRRANELLDTKKQVDNAFNSTNGGNSILEAKMIFLMNSLEEKMKSVDHAAESLRFLAEKAEVIDRVQAAATLSLMDRSVANQSTSDSIHDIAAKRSVQTLPVPDGMAAIGEELSMSSKSIEKRASLDRGGSSIAWSSTQANGKNFFVAKHQSLLRASAQAKSGIDEVNQYLQNQRTEMATLSEEKSRLKKLISTWKKKYKKSHGGAEATAEIMAESPDIADTLKQLDVVTSQITSNKVSNFEVNSRATALQSELLSADFNIEENAKEFFRLFGEPISNYTSLTGDSNINIQLSENYGIAPEMSMLTYDESNSYFIPQQQQQQQQQQQSEVAHEPALQGPTATNAFGVDIFSALTDLSSNATSHQNFSSDVQRYQNSALPASLASVQGVNNRSTEILNNSLAEEDPLEKQRRIDIEQEDLRQKIAQQEHNRKLLQLQSELLRPVGEVDFMAAWRPASIQATSFAVTEMKEPSTQFEKENSAEIFTIVESKKEAGTEAKHAEIIDASANDPSNNSAAMQTEAEVPAERSAREDLHEIGAKKVENNVIIETRSSTDLHEAATKQVETEIFAESNTKILQEDTAMKAEQLITDKDVEKSLTVTSDEYAKQLPDESEVQDIAESVDSTNDQISSMAAERGSQGVLATEDSSEDLSMTVMPLELREQNKEPINSFVDEFIEHKAEIAVSPEPTTFNYKDAPKDISVIDLPERKVDYRVKSPLLALELLGLTNGPTLTLEQEFSLLQPPSHNNFPPVPTIPFTGFSDLFSQPTRSNILATDFSSIGNLNGTNAAAQITSYPIPNAFVFADEGKISNFNPVNSVPTSYDHQVAPASSFVTYGSLPSTDISFLGPPIAAAGKAPLMLPTTTSVLSAASEVPSFIAPSTALASNVDLRPRSQTVKEYLNGKYGFLIVSQVQCYNIPPAAKALVDSSSSYVLLQMGGAETPQRSTALTNKGSKIVFDLDSVEFIVDQMRLEQDLFNIKVVDESSFASSTTICQGTMSFASLVDSADLNEAVKFSVQLTNRKGRPVGSAVITVSIEGREPSQLQIEELKARTSKSRQGVSSARFLSSASARDSSEDDGTSFSRPQSASTTKPKEAKDDSIKGNALLRVKDIKVSGLNGDEIVSNIFLQH